MKYYENITELLPNIYIFNNESLFGEKINVYLIEGSKNIILFDIPQYSNRNKAFLKSLNKPIIGLISHGPSSSNDGALWQKEFGIKFYLHPLDINSKWLNMIPNILDEKMIKDLKDNLQIKITNTPGHTNGSICIYHERSKSLFTGDSILYKNNNFEIEAKNSSLRKVMQYDFKNILPLHNEIILGNAKVLLKKNLNKNFSL